jgi:hypothetical protein
MLIINELIILGPVKSALYELFRSDRRGFIRVKNGPVEGTRLILANTIKLNDLFQY